MWIPVRPLPLIVSAQGERQRWADDRNGGAGESMAAW
jgi:hypothetical protein